MTNAFLLVAVFCALCAVNAYAPTKNRFLLIPSFFSSWLTIELAPWLLFWEVVVVSGFVLAGAVDGLAGWIALVLSIANAVALIGITVVARRTSLILNNTCADLDLGDAPPFPKSHVFFPLIARRRKGVRVVRNITFAEYGKKKLKLDVVKADGAAPGDCRPGILQVHGGAWMLGDKREQGIPLLLHLAANGWVGINANYRLSPRAAFPDHLVDLKQAIAWYREHADEHGADPNFLCVTGGSAGGHLCALIALTANDPEYQPGFEDVDTSVRAAVPFYGVYDFTNRNGTWHKDTIKRFFEPMVMKRRISKDPEAFAKASPMDQVRRDAPPFLVIHGDLDTLAPVEDARDFVRLLTDVSDLPVLYIEMKGAQHAFDIFPSYRTARIVEAVERFVHNVHERRPVEELADH